MEYTAAEVALIQKTVAQDASDAELELFIYACKRTGLDPLMRQIHLVLRGTGDKRKAVIQTGIDGYRLIAARTGEYAGNDDAQFHAVDEKHPIEATITIWRMVNGIRCPFTATARWFEYAPVGEGAFMWNKMPFTMLGKVAEALALRKAFPAELSGVYAEEEMAQADNVRPVAAIPQRTVTRPEPQPAPADAPRGLCPTHHVPFVNKRGVSKAKADGTPGKPYDFWACSADVKPWCQEKPADAPARAPEAKAGVVVPAGERVTREQVAVIYAAGAKADRNETQVQMEVAKGFSGRKPEELTPDEAQRVITGYTRHAEAKQAQVPLDTPEKE